MAELLLPAFVPFNLLKGGINTALTLLIYKPLVTTLRKSNLISFTDTASEKKRMFNMGITLVAAVVLITCVMAVMVMRGAM